MLKGKNKIRKKNKTRKKGNKNSINNYFEKQKC